MKIQLALDFINIEEAIELLRRIIPYIDWVEVGTPMIKKDGVKAVAEIKKVFSDHFLVADMKTADAGAWEAELAFGAGADLINILGCADNATISSVVKVARKKGKVVCADLLGVKDKLQRARELECLEIDYLCIHVGVDEQKNGKDPLDGLRMISGEVNTPLIVAGGINVNTVARFKPFNPEVIIVGSGITGASNPVEAAKKLKNIVSSPDSE